MSRKKDRIDCWKSSCECLERAFRQVRMGDARHTPISRTSNHCPVREVDPSVVGDFLECIGALQDESPSKPVMPLR